MLQQQSHRILLIIPLMQDVKKVLDIDTVTNRILSDIKSQDIADVFPESSATHAGQIGIKKLPDSTYEVSLFENGSLTTDLTYILTDLHE